MFHCPVGVGVIEQHAMMLSATVLSSTMEICPQIQIISKKTW